MNKKEIWQFITFLKENNAYSAYKHNIRTPNFSSELTNDLANLVNRFDGECDELISYSFNWKMTKEGGSYWYHLHLKWLKVRQGIKKLSTYD